ncbi:fluoride efflux transporter CrcB [Donghicola sp. C2-DW-16]|uniref:Fluoride-specific ion channel FluC n=1 Tax=Donghicola mangrovi TaxID=2729614 RepID=A0A850PYM2_9RHOB|nr:fluoride efflux transporter CrcB [Donghicola mangrovi]NVO21913.1 fluoride efflux transporter CrcB [Donghicola mangrovi]NVO26497.1 fluoride efflux transporter CrcB [Donghicola mangrovi]
MIFTVLQVALGGAIGASFRYLTNVSVMRLLGPGFPWGTVVCNVIGSFAMGVLVVVLANTGNNKYAPLLMTGLLGGFTTFSAFSLDAVTLFERGALMPAAAYVLTSVVVSIIALSLGLLFARGIVS